MSKKSETIRYELPNHRIKILFLTIFGLLLFLLYALSKLDEKISLFDFFLILLTIVLGIWLKRFLKKFSKIGFLINELGIFNLDESIICKIENIKKIDVSPYTFKSANGFIIFQKTKGSFKIVPGLYWRAGKRISIGGLISKNESKFLSSTLLEIIKGINQRTQ